MIECKISTFLTAVIYVSYFLLITATHYSTINNTLYSLTFSDRQSALSTNFYPPLEINPNKDSTINFIDLNGQFDSE